MCNQDPKRQADMTPNIFFSNRKVPTSVVLFKKKIESVQSSSKTPNLKRLQLLFYIIVVNEKLNISHNY